MKTVVQEDATGCELACVATLANLSYQQIKSIALGMEITVTNSRFWSETGFVRTLLHQVLPAERLFVSREALPSHALLATKWHRKKNEVF